MQPAPQQGRIWAAWEKLRAASNGLDATRAAYREGAVLFIAADPELIPRLEKREPEIREVFFRNMRGGSYSNETFGIDRLEFLAADAGSRAALVVAHEALRIGDDAATRVTELEGR
jgi:hypothetical protein